MDLLYTKTTNFDYGQNWVSDNDYLSLKQLGESSIKLHYLEKSLKSQRRLEQRQKNLIKDNVVDDSVNEKYKYDKNAVVGKKFPFKADDFKYPNQEREKPKSLYIKYSDEYGKHMPNDLELPEKFFPINNTFTKKFTYNYKNHSLNTAPSYSKVHKALDSIY